MADNNSGSNKSSGPLNKKKLDAIVAQAHKQRDVRLAGYREQSLKIHPWVCGRCGRTFTRENLHELTVHHKDHNHDNNPANGSNWENLCLYCHDNEHQRFSHLISGEGYTLPAETKKAATHSPFASLKDLLKPPKG